ncbi:MAG: hypothetical protein ACUVQL_00735 [Candidatus Bathycorpusculaceae bacterium]
MKVKGKKGEPKRFVYDKRLVYVGVAAAIIVISAMAFLFIFYPNQPSEPKAAIIDQLSSSQLSVVSRWVNETFVENAKALLYKRFSRIDYYSDNATVEQYSRLASLNYKLIIWRAHSAVDPEKYVAICSSEQYIPGKYEQYTSEQLKLCNITGDPFLYFAITPKFIEECMSGRFEDTVIVFMSCNGLSPNYTKTAETFVNNKGVKVFISWDGWIEKADNDNAIALLLKYLIEDNRTISEAVTSISPYYSIHGTSRLRYYPPTSEVADYRIPSYKQSNVSSSMIFPPNFVLRRIRRAN